MIVVSEPPPTWNWQNVKMKNIEEEKDEHMDLVPIQVFQEASCKLECCKLPKEINNKNHK